MSIENLRQAIEQKNQAEAVRLIAEMTELSTADKAEALIMLVEMQSEIEDEMNKQLLPLLQQAVTMARDGSQIDRELQDSQKLADLRKTLDS